jgi:hypothetical protein
MLFYCDLTSELRTLHEDTLSEAFSELLRAHRLGHHLVVITRESATWLEEHVHLSIPDGAMLRRVAQTYSQTGDLPRRAAVFVRLCANRDSNLTVNGKTVNISIEGLLRYRLLDKVALVSENQAFDGCFYEFLLRNHCDLHSCSPISFDLHHGGGPDTVRVFGALVNDRRIVCGIFDSDRNTPGSDN